MKQTVTDIAIAFFLVISSFTLQAQVLPGQPEKQLLHKWLTVSSIINGEPVAIPDNIQNTGLEFKTDHTFWDIPNSGIPAGTWNYHAEEAVVTLFVDGVLIGRITYMDDNTLKYTVVVTEEMKQFISSYEIYYRKAK